MRTIAVGGQQLLSRLTLIIKRMMFGGDFGMHLADTLLFTYIELFKISHFSSDVSHDFAGFVHFALLV